MAAYAALVSLMHIIDQIQHHPRPPISLDQVQVESLTKKVTFLQEFLEGYSHVGYSKDADSLESRIADAAYAAEDVIESHIMDQIHGGSTSDPEKTSSADLCIGLQKVMEDMDLIKKEVMVIAKENMGIQDQLHRYLSISAGSLRSASTGQNTTMVGFDDILNEVMDKLTGLQCNLQVIPIVGMGGMGKTTLARNIYANPLIVQHFDILAWVTISQVYSMREIILEVLCQNNKWSMKDLSQNSDYELGEILYKDLIGRRYLIVLDDIWSNEAWDKVKFCFPDNNNGSRIIMTTRLSNLAFQLSGCYVIPMKFLDEDKSWNLLCKIVFGKEDCPIELEEVGKKIVKNCRGLPLSIVVIGGLLTKHKGKREYWEFTLENLNSAINLEDDERCLQILYTSYKELPIHLKPCFLYMEIFPEDSEIRVSKLIQLWVAEGFLRPIDGKSLEVVAEEYFTELIDRNIILVHKLGSNGKPKFCKIHDLLRDLCLREAQKQKFLCVRRLHNLNSPQCINTERRIVIHGSTSKDEYNPTRFLHALQSASLARSLIVDYKRNDVEKVLRQANLRLLRVFKADCTCSVRERKTWDRFILRHKLYNLRLFSSEDMYIPLHRSPHLYWNLHTLNARRQSMTVFPGIWKMPLLRHVELNIFSIPDPLSGPMDMRDDFVLGNLQKLSEVGISNCREKVVERIPNVKKLKISYSGELDSESLYCLNNLGKLRKLEHLNCYFLKPKQLSLLGKPIRSELLQNLTLPRSLKKLTLHGCRLHWEDITTKIGPLPLLEVLKLEFHSIVGPEWVTVEGQFCSLKFLLIYFCDDLVYWTTDSTHFPCLQHLRLQYLGKLKEIPWGIGEIPTLQSIELVCCSYSAVISAKRILEEQEELGNESLRVRVQVYEYDKAPQSLGSQNFPVEIIGGDGSSDSGSGDSGSDDSDCRLGTITCDMLSELSSTYAAWTAEIEEIPMKVTNESVEFQENQKRKYERVAHVSRLCFRFGVIRGKRVDNE